MNCPVCGNGQVSFVYPDTLGEQLPRLDYGFSPDHQKTYEIRRCGVCTHLFAVPPRKGLWEAYREVVDLAYLARRRERALTFPKLVRRIRTFVPSGALLDVGCATGDFLAAAAPFFQVEGVEPSSWSSCMARARGFQVHQGPLSEVLGEARFDVVTLWGVVGLFEEPRREVAHMARLLRPGGIVALWTGDMASLPARLLGRRYWYVMGQYLQLFTARSLDHLFQSFGFERIWRGTYPFTSTLRLLAHSLRRYPLGRWVGVLLSGPWGGLPLTLPLPGELFVVYRRG